MGHRTPHLQSAPEIGPYFCLGHPCLLNISQWQQESYPQGGSRMDEERGHRHVICVTSPVHWLWTSWALNKSLLGGDVGSSEKWGQKEDPSHFLTFSRFVLWDKNHSFSLFLRRSHNWQADKIPWVLTRRKEDFFNSDVAVFWSSFTSRGG